MKRLAAILAAALALTIAATSVGASDPVHVHSSSTRAPGGGRVEQRPAMGGPLAVSLAAPSSTSTTPAARAAVVGRPAGAVAISPAGGASQAPGWPRPHSRSNAAEAPARKGFATGSGSVPRACRTFPRSPR